MMKYIYLCFLFFVTVGSASAQVSVEPNRNPAEKDTAYDPKKIRICAPSRAGIIANQPLWVVNGVVVHGDIVREYIQPSSIQSMNVLKGVSATSTYGASAQNGAVIINLKNGSKLYGLEDLLKNFKIKKKYRNLPVFIEQRRLTNYADFYIASDMVKEVEIITTEDELMNKEKFIKVWLKPL
ncbi:hypothetical protein ACS5PU_07470 [Pedobacter sp. GSP4]|uniref:hypothetical protein n=1 Tax=Pedobacter sp. GSP4 TaxID=3453716 RepID=UPI003EEDE264